MLQQPMLDPQGDAKKRVKIKLRGKVGQSMLKPQRGHSAGPGLPLENK